MARTIAWVSAGAASAISGRMILRENPNAVMAYCETGGEHEDNERFLSDLTRWFNAPIERLKSEKYADTWDVWQKTRWLAGPEGARCTTELKVVPRLLFQRPTDVHVFGYTADSSDVRRADLLASNYPELTLRFPLIEAGITKAACLALLETVGIAAPVLYALGFQNNNCIGCVKATSPDYWSLVRLHFLAIFQRMAKLSRELDVRLCRIHGERCFIDEIPPDWPTTNPIAPACDFLCHLIEMDFVNG